MSDLRTLGTGVIAYAVDHGQYPPASTIGELASKLEPTYLGATPRRDMWGHDYKYECWKANPEAQGCDAFTVASAGADGVFQHLHTRDYQKGRNDDPDVDLVFGRSGLPAGSDSDGEFIQGPAYISY